MAIPFRALALGLAPLLAVRSGDQVVIGNQSSGDLTITRLAREPERPLPFPPGPPIHPWPHPPPAPPIHPWPRPSPGPPFPPPPEPPGPALPDPAPWPQSSPPLPQDPGDDGPDWMGPEAFIRLLKRGDTAVIPDPAGRRGSVDAELIIRQMAGAGGLVFGELLIAPAPGEPFLGPRRVRQQIQY